HLLRLLNDGPVTPADVSVSATFQSQACNDVDAQIDLVGEIWIEIGETIPIDAHISTSSLESAAPLDSTFIVAVKLPKEFAGVRFLVEHPFARDLHDVGLLEVNEDAKTILKT